MQNTINIIRQLKLQQHFMEANADKVIYDNSWRKTNGISVVDTPKIYALHIYEYEGLRYSYHYYGEGYHLGNGFSYKDRYYNLWSIEKQLPDLLADGYQPKDYVRSEKARQQIEAIKRLHRKYKQKVASFSGWGEIGDRLRSYGCHVHYDGGSVCDFSKDFLNLHAHTNEYPKTGWHLEDYCSVHLEDGSLSERFYVTDNENDRSLERDFEWIFGEEIPELGRFYTERELFEAGKVRYRQYRVRFHVPRENGTLKYFDSFEEAKAFAYEEARRRAESVKDDRRRYAFCKPVDYADRTDTLAAFLYYRYDRGSEHIIFVQGENS